MKPTALPAFGSSRTQSTIVELLESRIAPASLVVTTLSDTVAADGFVSLREAIQAANTNLAVNEAGAGDADGDSITFDPALSGSISLGSVLSIVDDLSIDGDVLAGRITLDGLDTVQILNINTTGGAGTNTDVALSNLILEDGSVTGNGGAIAHAANALTLENVDISSSSANGAGASGGAVFSAGTLTVNGGVFTGNTSVRAGGAFEMVATSVSVLNNVTVDGNSTGPTPGNGGGLHITGAGNVTVNGGTFSGNSASAEGGGLWNSSTGTLIIFGTSITSNIANGDVDPLGVPANLQGGGGVFNDGGTLTVSFASFIGNLAQGATRGSGGGLMSIAGLVTVSQTSFFDNEAIRAGGAVEIIAGTVDFNGITFSSNDVSAAGVLATANPGNGGAIHVTGAATVNINNAQSYSNEAAAEGGAFWNSATGTMNVKNSLFIDNMAFGDGTEQGGGAFFNDGGTVVISDSSFQSNDSTATAVGNGGGAIFNDGIMSIFGTTFGSNTATAGSGNGGAILNSDGGVLTVSGGEFGSNQAARAGGAIENNLGSVFLNSVRMEQNSAGINGGAVHTSGAGGVEIQGGRYLLNTAGNEGGALWNSATGFMSINKATIESNTAVTGGGVFQKGGGGTLEVRATSILFNSASGALGGGGLASEGGTILIGNSTLGGNTANAGPGGGVLIAAGTVDIYNSTISINSATSGAAGIQQSAGTISLISTIVGGNYGDDVVRVTGTLNSANSLVQSVLVGTVNGIDTASIYGVDPQLNGLSENGGFTRTFSLSPFSPAIDQGSNLLAFTTDQRGAPFARSQGSAPDMGSFEAPPAPTVTIAANGKKATFTDVDGDLVTITTNVGTFDQSNFHLESAGIGARLLGVDLFEQSEFTGANISIKAKRSALGGDGFVNVGGLDAGGVDLGKVLIDGDLEYFAAGDENLATPGALGLTVVSLGEFEHEAEVNVYGSLNNLTVRTDIYEADIHVFGGPSANLGVMKVGGSIDYTDIYVDGGMTSLTVTGYVEDSDIHVGGSVGSITATPVPGKFRAVGGIVVKGYLDETHIGVNGDLANLRISGYVDELDLTVRGDLAPGDILAAQTIGNIVIGGRVSDSELLIGYNLDFQAVNPEVQVGAVTISGTWNESSLAVGTVDGGDAFFGTEDDAAIAGGSGGIVSRIAMLTMKGHVYGSFYTSEDFYGVSAQEIVKAKLGLANLPLTPGAGNDLVPILFGNAFDFAVREVAVPLIIT